VRKLSWLSAFMLLIGLVWVLPAAAYQPQGGAMFNVPRPWGSDTEKYRLVRHVEKAINKTRPTAADPNPVILISTYLLDRSQSVDAMIGACRRGVSVRVILDEDIVNKNSKRLIAKLNGDNVKDEDKDGIPDNKPKTGPCGKDLPGQRVVPGFAEGDTLTDRQARLSVDARMATSVTWGKDGSYVKRCDGSCRGAGGNMHSKFYAFSKTGKAQNVVIVSSSNLNRGGALLGWNDMYTMKRRPKSFQTYNQIHREMTNDNRAGDGKVEVRDGPYTSRFFPMRHAGKRNDPTLQDLKKIKCSSAFGRTKIFVSMFYWKGTRGNYIADKLLSLAGNGCQVSIIYGAPSVQIAERLRNAARAHRINLYDSRWDHNNDGYNEVRTHAKYVAVKGTFGKDRSAYMVMTGSQNWVSGSLSRGDETTLNIALASAYNDYVRNWTNIRNHSRRLPYN
jgi:phosphatidylserine/phosphatidylglycerophosphate/cardiolipin synthase-like enzyme